MKLVIARKRHCEVGFATEAISLRNWGIASQSLAMTRVFVLNSFSLVAHIEC